MPKDIVNSWQQKLDATITMRREANREILEAMKSFDGEAYTEACYKHKCGDALAKYYRMR